MYGFAQNIVESGSSNNGFYDNHDLFCHRFIGGS